MQLNSKVCLERLLKYVNINEADLITKYGYSALNDIKTIKQDLEVLEWLKKSIISKKRIQSLIETANPIYEIILHIPQNILKEVLGNGC